MELQIYAFNYVIQLWLATEVHTHTYISALNQIKYKYLILFIYRLCLKPN